MPKIIDTNTVDPWDMTSFREVWLGRKSQEDALNVHKADLELLTKEKGKLYKENDQLQTKNQTDG